MWFEKMFIVNAHEERLRRLRKNWRPFCLPVLREENSRNPVRKRFITSALLNDAIELCHKLQFLQHNEYLERNTLYNEIIQFTGKCEACKLTTCKNVLQSSFIFAVRKVVNIFRTLRQLFLPFVLLQYLPRLFKSRAERLLNLYTVV